MSLPQDNSFKIGWRSPSNIALVKYWGKKGNQLPQNPSVSFTLSESFTETFVTFEGSEKNEISVFLEFEGNRNKAFEERIKTFLEKLTPNFPFLKKYHLTVKTGNSFPHSAGIASSASAMSALALCLCSAEQKITGKSIEDKELFKKASQIARLGSGSACRSVYGEVVLWGKSISHNESSDEYGVQLKAIHPIFSTFRDAVLITDAGQKAVSSSQGHQLMTTNPYAETRFEEAKKNTINLTEALKKGDTKKFIEITEHEALVLHALMMASDPGFILINSKTLAIIEAVRHYRKQTGTPVCFTLDAGPNVHLLYPEKFSSEIESFILKELIKHCESKQIIWDKVGSGPNKIPVEHMIYEIKK